MSCNSLFNSYNSNVDRVAPDKDRNLTVFPHKYTKVVYEKVVNMYDYVCQYCGKKFSNVKKNKKFCSLECANKAHAKHKEINTRLFKIWHNIRSRCYCKSDSGYKNYGGRGITACNEWSEFLPFKKWALENGYNDNLSIDRIDVNGNYCPENCRWATAKIQMNNRRNTTYVNYKGEKVALSILCERLNLNYNTIVSRIRDGWDTEKAIDTPIKDKFESKKVICLDTNKVYNSAKEIAQELGVHVNAVRNHLRGETRTCKGMKYKYLEKETA